MGEQEHAGVINDDSISNAISKLMAHHEIIGAVASAIGGTPGGNFANTTAAEKAASPEDSSETEAKSVTTAAATNDITEPDLAASLMPIISRLGSLKSSGGGANTGRHASLLCALKPYLSKNRCDAIDYMLKISQMSDIISKLH